jgi:F-type H+-transporting ATPase subunit a
MNLLGLVPFFKSPTADWSNTMGLALIVFCYVTYTAFREFGIFGYFDHHMGKPRGIWAWSVLLPFFLFMVSIHMVGELIRPLTLSLRLRCNILAEEQLLVVFTGFGWVGGFLSGFAIYLFDLLGAIIQAFVFSLLTLVYLSLAMHNESEQH